MTYNCVNFVSPKSVEDKFQCSYKCITCSANSEDIKQLLGEVKEPKC